MNSQRVILAFGLCTVAGLWGCVESSISGEPNSDQGYLFVELDEALAVDWQSEVLVKGPATGAEHCDNERGCYLDHQPLEMHEVVSSDPEVVEVREFKDDSYGDTDAVRLMLDVVGEGEATLEFRFDAEGIAVDDATEGEEAEDSDGASDSDGDDGADAGESESIADSFSVEAREVASLHLERRVGDVDPAGPYGLCPSTGAGTYLLSQVDEMQLEMGFEKLDAGGRRLRGSGGFPVDIEPDDAVEVVDVDEPNHSVTIEPTQFGSVTMTPEGHDQSVEHHFLRAGDLTAMDARLYRLDEQGGRAGATSTMIVDAIYEIEALPGLSGDQPLCGGRVATSVNSMTPAICDEVGVMETTGNPAVTAAHGGVCRLRVSLETGTAGASLVEEHTYDVQYSW